MSGRTRSNDWTILGFRRSRELTHPTPDLQQVIIHAENAFDDPDEYFKNLSKLVAFKTESQISASLPILFDFLKRGVGPLFKELGYHIKIF